MKTTIACVKAMSFAAIALGALSASAEIKYWDNPAYRAFDVGDYVQSGLLLHYDGIRNAGAAADHDPNATVWKNLGTGGAAYDMMRGGAAQSSAWTEKGYRFGNDAYFRSAAKHELDEYYELDNTKLYISGGIDTNSFKFRLNNKPSFNLFRLRNK